MDCSDLADHKELVENMVASLAEFPMKSEANMRLLPNATGWQQQNAKRPAWSFFLLELPQVTKYKLLAC